MTVSDISRERFAYVQESSFGVQETAHKLKILRMAGETLKQNTQTTTSREIRDDRQIPGVIRTNIDVAGAVNFELSFESFDDLFALALFSPNVQAQGLLTMDTLPTDGNTITFGTTTYQFKTTPAAAEDIFIEAADLPGTQANLVATINGTGVAGTNYYAGTTSPHPLVEAGTFASDDSIITALAAGVAGNSIATTETFTAETNIFDAATLGTTTLGAGWTAPITVTASTISASSVDNSFNDSGSGFGSISAGDWIKASSFTAAADNGHFKVVTATAAKLIVSGGTLVTEAAGASRTIKVGNTITNGTTKTSVNWERTYTDLTTELALYLGCMVNSLSLTVNTRGIITGNVGIQGASESSETVSGGLGYVAANSNEIMNSMDHVAGIYENQTSINVLDFSLTVTNNLRKREEMATPAPTSFGADALNVSGSFSAYYESKTLYDKYLDFTTTSLAKVFQDTAGNSYVIDMPEVKITDAARHGGAGLGDDFKIPCTFQAVRDATEDVTIRIVRFAA